MKNSEMKHLLDQMHSATDGVQGAEELLNDPENKNDVYTLNIAQELKDKCAIRLANLTSEFLTEIVKRRHKTGNFQYPF